MSKIASTLNLVNLEKEELQELINEKDRIIANQNSRIENILDEKQRILAENKQLKKEVDDITDENTLLHINSEDD